MRGTAGANCALADGDSQRHPREGGGPAKGESNEVAPSKSRFSFE